MRMTIAVSGAGGFVGRAVLARIEQAGFLAVPLNRTVTGQPMERVTGDLGAASIGSAILAGVDSVIHLAARAHSPKDGDDTIARYRAVNVHGTQALVAAAAAAGVRRFVYVSSIKAVGERSLPGQPLHPSTPLAPEDAFGISKREAERAVREDCEAAGIEWVIVRPPLVYGPGVKANFRSLVKLVRTGLPIPLGAIRNRRSLLYVGNLAAALVSACDAHGANGRILMLSDTASSTPDLLRAIAAAAGVKARVVAMPLAMLRAVAALLGKGAEMRRVSESLEIDATSSWDALGHGPEYSVEEGLRATVHTL